MTSAVVLGDALLDVLVCPAVQMRPGADVPAEIRIGPGGQGANLAVRLARQGVDTILVCGLGDDPAATILREALEAEGVRLAPVRAAATGSVVILLDEAGERTMLSNRAPFASAAGERMPPETDWIVVSGYLLLEADGLALARSLANRGVRRVLVGCAVPGDGAGWLAAANALAPDLTVLNQDEAAALGATPASVGGGLVVTDATGAVATVGGVSVETRAPAGETALDTTGAGDAFVASLIAELSRAIWPPAPDELERALAAAAERGAAVARTSGAQGRIEAETARAPRSG